MRRRIASWMYFAFSSPRNVASRTWPPTVIAIVLLEWNFPNMLLSDTSDTLWICLYGIAVTACCSPNK